MCTLFKWSVIEEVPLTHTHTHTGQSRWVRNFRLHWAGKTLTTTPNGLQYANPLIFANSMQNKSLHGNNSAVRGRSQWAGVWCLLSTTAGCACKTEGEGACDLACKLYLPWMRKIPLTTYRLKFEKHGSYEEVVHASWWDQLHLCVGSQRGYVGQTSVWWELNCCAAFGKGMQLISGPLMLKPI